LLVLSWALDGAARVVQGGGWLAWLTPLHLYSRSKPLIADYGADAVAFLGLLALTFLCGALCFPLFARRDLGGVVWRGRPVGRTVGTAAALDSAARELGLRGVASLALRANRSSAAWWLVGLGILTLFIVGITRATKDTLSSILSGSPVLLQLFASGNLASDAGFLSGILFFFLPLTVAFYALALAVGWARDLDGGYYELPLGTPTTRRWIYLGSWAATLGGLLVVPLVLWLITLLGIGLWGLTISRGDLLVAFLGLLALELPVAAFVYLVAGRLGAGATLGLGGGALVLFFALGLVGPLLGWPEWVLGLSLFHQFGTPLTAAPRWSAWAALVGIAAVFLFLGLVRFERGDIQRGN
jgi:ABC-2 type transport system permease protein